MIKALYYLYFKQFGILNKNQFITRVIIRLSNIILPFYFTVTNKFFNSNSLTDNSQNTNLIVSITTFPSRINKVWLTIETILRQEKKPDKILLWLYKDEFPDKNYLPNNLLQLEKRGLEIRFCKENLLPHKKYYYTMLEYPKASIITIDDDFYFPPNLIKKLISFHIKYPNSILCPITREIETKNQHIEPYKKWSYRKINTEPMYSNLTMGGGGTLFPPNSLHQDVFDKDKLIKIALRADDLWLKVMSIKQGTKVVSIAGEYPRFFIPIRNKNDKRLMDSNIGDGNNDKVFNELLDHYQIPIEKFNE